MSRYLPDDNLSYPIQLTLDSGGAGSGFYFNYEDKNLFIVTARHVLFNNLKKKETDPDQFELKRFNFIEVLSYCKDISIIDPIIARLDTSQFSKEYIKCSDKYDVAVIKIADFSKHDDGTSGMKATFFDGYRVISDPSPNTGIVGVPNKYFKKFEDALVSNEVFIFGYPISLGTGAGEIEHRRPLLRKGIVAGKNFQNRTLILDCPSYQGNSGGLALEIEAETRLTRAIGVVSGFIPFIEVFESFHFKYKNTAVENSGYSVVVPIDVVESLAASFTTVVVPPDEKKN